MDGALLLLAVVTCHGDIYRLKTDLITDPELEFYAIQSTSTTGK